MRREIVLFLIIASLAVVGWLVFGNSENRVVLQGEKLKVGEAVVYVEIMDKPSERARGLSGRESLGESQGMLFIYPGSRRHSFWMKEMNFALDIIFIDEGKVVEIHEDVPVPVGGQDGREIKIQTKLETEWVLEVNAGWVESNGVEVGDAVQLVSKD